MLRVLFALLVAALLPNMAEAETVIPLSVGGSQVRCAVGDEFIRLSEKLPTMFAMEAAQAPKSNRLVEGFISESDAKRMTLGLKREGVLFEVQVIRDMEALDFTEADWLQARPMLAKAMGGIDLKSLVNDRQASADQRMSDTMGQKVAVRFGDVGKPVFYGDDPRSLRFVTLVSAAISANGKMMPIQMETAGAIVRLKNKLLFVYANRNHEAGSDTTAVRAALDGFLGRAMILNQDASPASPAAENPVASPKAPG